MTNDQATILITVIAVVAVILALVVLTGTIFIVRHRTAAVVERFGRFLRVANSGIRIKIPIVDRIAGRVSLRTRQLDVMVETKTEDNVFVNVHVSVQFRVPDEQVYDAFYMLEDPERQIESYVFDTVRARVPEILLDDVFVKKDSIADAVREELEHTMTEFGYFIKKALVNDIIPDAKVKISMNEINAALRMREAAKEKAEAEKIMRVKAAEAEAESKRLQGEGIANQRREIASGLRDSVDLLNNVEGVDTGEVMKTVLLTQYLDTLAAVADSSVTNSIFIPHSPGVLTSLDEQIRNAILEANAGTVNAFSPPEKEAPRGGAPAARS